MTFVRSSSVVCLAITLLVVGAPVKAHESERGEKRPKLDAALRTAPEQARTRVIIQVSPGAGGAVKGLLLKNRQARVLRELPVISALVADVPQGLLQVLEHRADVRAISLDSQVAAPPFVAEEVDPPMARRSSRSIVGLDHSSYTGAGVGIAVFDSGIQRSPEFGSRLTHFYDFTRGGMAAAATDAHGHGTHVAGLIAANGARSKGTYVGVAPGASIVGIKVLDAAGAGYTSDVIAGLEFTIAHRARLGVDVINLSLGHPPLESAETDPLVRAVEAAVRAGIVVVTSAGNAALNAQTGEPGYGGIVSPGIAPSALTIGSAHNVDTPSESDDIVAAYSSRGPTWFQGLIKPDLVAPGGRLIGPAASGSTLVRNNPSRLVPGTGGAYIQLSGTSMAAAVTSGVVAVLIEASRAANASAGGEALTPNALKAVLHYSSVPLRHGSELPSIFAQGAGLLNAPGASALSRAIDTSAPPSAWWLSDAIEPVAGGRHVWGQTVFWGTRPIRGHAVYTNLPAWSRQVRWGSEVPWSGDVLLGQDMVREELATWASSTVWGAILIWGDSFDFSDILIWGDTLLGNYDDILIWGDTEER